MRIVVAMSGGVDSSVAAALLAAEGHEVIGLSMQLYDQRNGETGFGSCCTIDDLHDARRVAVALGVPHYLVNFEREFDDQVISNFVREYLAGRTPIPCAHCNSDLKFTTLLERARGLDAERVATGHYAQVSYDSGRQRYLLCRGADAAKDQSYFLFSLTQEQLARAWFPVGAMRKEEVRTYARAHRLPVAEKPDSHDICFVPSGQHAGFIERRAGRTRPGFLQDTAGRVLGRHDGVHRFTVGQRKGLNLSAGVPLYVLEIRADTDTIVVGPREALGRTRLTASAANWIACEPASSWMNVTAQIRYRHTEAVARLRALESHRVEVEFDVPQTAVAPGQAVVFYQSDVVVGGGWID